MATPKIDVFITSILSSPAIRSRHERVLRHLQSLGNVPFQTHDVAGSDEAKRFWKRKATSTELPCVLVDSQPVGSVEEMDEAVEFGELRQFLRLDHPASLPTPPPPAAYSSATHKPQASLDDFSSLSLTPSELAELTAELEASKPTGYHPSSPDTTQTFTPSRVEPLKFKMNLREEIVRPLGDRPLAERGREDLLEGIPDLSDEDARALARELGLDDDEQGLVTGYSAAASSKEKKLPPAPESSAAVKVVVEEEPQAPTLPEKTSEGMEKEAWAKETTAVEGKGGAELSAPLEAVEELHLNKRDVQQLKEYVEENGSTLTVEPVSDLEKLGPIKEETPRVKKENGSTKKEVEQVKKDLDVATGRLGGFEEQVPVALAVQDGALEDKVASAISAGEL